MGREQFLVQPRPQVAERRYIRERASAGRQRLQADVAPVLPCNFSWRDRAWVYRRPCPDTPEGLHDGPCYQFSVLYRGGCLYIHGTICPVFPSPRDSPVPTLRVHLRAQTGDPRGGSLSFQMHALGQGQATRAIVPCNQAPEALEVTGAQPRGPTSLPAAAVPRHVPAQLIQPQKRWLCVARVLLPFSPTGKASAASAMDRDPAVPAASAIGRFGGSRAALAHAASRLLSRVAGYGAAAPFVGTETLQRLPRDEEA